MILRSLKFKLMSLVLAVAVVSNVAMALIARNLASNTVDDTVHLLLDSVTNNVAGTIQDEIALQYRLLEGLASFEFLQDDSIPYHAKAAQIQETSKVGNEYENIGFYDPQGNTVTADGRLVNLAEREYFRTAIGGNRYVSDPYFSTVVNKMFQTFSVPVKNKSGKAVGIISCNIYGDTLSKKIGNINKKKDAQIVVANRKTGIIVATTSPEYIKTGEKISDVPTPPEIKPIIDNMLKGGIGGGSFTDPALGSLNTAAYRPVEGVDWSVLYICPYTDFFQGLTAMIRMMTITLSIILIIAFAASYFTAHFTIQPLIAVKGAVLDIASGDANLTKRIASATKDEIGDVVRGFNAFTEKLQEIISQVKKSKSSLGMAGGDLEASTEDTTASISQILASIDSVHDHVTKQGQSVHETAGAVNQIASNIESLERMIEKQSNGVAEASAAVEEMIGNIRSVNKSVEKMSSSFEQLSENAQSGTEVQRNVNERVEEIKSLSETLQEANSAIAAIAEQTNLLAMNAAIEAAHAGEAGKGFSVVADEIRKLSETSSEQSKTIGEQLTNIQNAISSVVMASGQSSDAFQSVTEKIRETDELVRQIKAAMQEQDEGSKQISTVLHTMNDSSIEVRNAGKEMMEGNRAILSEVQNLQEATGRIQTSMDDMSAGARKISETGDALRGISVQVKQSIDDIGQQIDKFIV